MAKRIKRRIRKARPLKIVPDENTSLAAQARSMHKSIERRLETQLSKLDVTCKKGCSFCCYKMVMVGISDGFMMAEAVLAKPDWREKALPRLLDDAKLACVGVNDDSTWFEKQTPCPMLDLDARTCTAYDSRPTPCRYHFVVSPVENCDPIGLDIPIKMIDLRSVEDSLARWQFETSQMIYGEGEVAVAPLSVMTIFCMAALTKDEEIVKSTQELTDPRRWWFLHRSVEEDMAGILAKETGDAGDLPVP